MGGDGQEWVGKTLVQKPNNWFGRKVWRIIWMDMQSKSLARIRAFLLSFLSEDQQGKMPLSRLGNVL